jgi:hypothetical protein
MMEGRNSPSTDKKEVVDAEQQVVVRLQALAGCHHASSTAGEQTTEKQDLA